MSAFTACVKQSSSPGWSQYVRIRVHSDDSGNYWETLDQTFDLPCGSPNFVSNGGSWKISDVPDPSNDVNKQTLSFKDGGPNQDWIMDFNGVPTSFLIDFTQQPWHGTGTFDPGRFASPDLTWVTGP